MKANNIIASESNKDVDVSSNYFKNPLGFNNIETKNEIDWLWCETCSATCSCSHHLIDHTRNDNSQQGHSSIKGCRFSYFVPYMVRKSKPKKEWGRR